MTSSAAYLRSLRRKHRKAGLCVQCKRPAMPNPKGGLFALCKVHKAKQLKVDRDGHAKRAALWEKLGICVSCGQRPSIKATVPETTDKRCGVCAEAQADAQARLKVKRREERQRAAWAAMLDELKRKNIGEDSEQRTRAHAA